MLLSKLIKDITSEQRVLYFRLGNLWRQIAFILTIPDLRAYKQNCDEFCTCYSANEFQRLHRKLQHLRITNTNRTHCIVSSHTSDKHSTRVQTDMDIKKSSWLINRSNKDIPVDISQLLACGSSFNIAREPKTEDTLLAIDALSKHLTDDIVKTRFQFSAMNKCINNKTKSRSNEAFLISKAKNFLEHNDLLLLPSDKGRQSVIITKDEYNEKAQLILGDTQQYQVLKNFSISSRNSLFNRKLKDILCPDYTQFYKSVLTTEAPAPRWYGLPKLHKPDVPLRPIVSMIGSVSYKLAKCLARMIAPLKGFYLPKHQAIDACSFRNEILQHQINPDEELASLDVESMYTSIPAMQAIEVAIDTLKSAESEV